MCGRPNTAVCKQSAVSGAISATTSWSSRILEATTTTSSSRDYLSALSLMRTLHLCTTSSWQEVRPELHLHRAMLFQLRTPAFVCKTLNIKRQRQDLNVIVSTSSQALSARESSQMKSRPQYASMHEETCNLANGDAAATLRDLREGVWHARLKQGCLRTDVLASDLLQQHI